MKQIEDTNYAINEFGEVFSLRFNPPRKLKPRPSSKGYTQVSIYNKGGKVWTIQPHRFVAKYFIPNPHNYPQVNHIDENRMNPSSSNLEWCTGWYNIDYSQSKSYQLTHKDGTTIKVRNLSEFARSLGKTGAGNFHKLLKKEIKTCYGFISIKELVE